MGKGCTTMLSSITVVGGWNPSKGGSSLMGCLIGWWATQSLLVGKSSPLICFTEFMVVFNPFNVLWLFQIKPQVNIGSAVDGHRNYLSSSINACWIATFLCVTCSDCFLHMLKMALPIAPDLNWWGLVIVNQLLHIGIPAMLGRSSRLWFCICQGGDKGCMGWPCECLDLHPSFMELCSWLRFAIMQSIMVVS